MIDIKDFYLNTPMKRYEYMRLKMQDIPDKIIKEYKLDQKTSQEPQILLANLTVTTVPFLRYPEKVTVS